MLFNSFPFLFVFLPIAYFGAFLMFRSRHYNGALAFLVLCSLFFYGFWNPRHLWVIVVSVLINYAIGGLIHRGEGGRSRRLYLVAGVVFNLGMLGFFKYLGFFTNILSAAGGDGNFFATVVNAALPIGISFYTFQQIAYLVDISRDHLRKPYSFREYAFFVTFFPQLIAGPIVHHAEIMPQLSRLSERLRGPRYAARYLAPGIAILVIGLGKKVLLADTFGGFADLAFAPASMGDLTFFAAWGGTSAYALQIYFDFSGYSDMAIGLGLMFGLRLPLNFDSPYKAASIIDFWRRWHMTLSRFLRNYLYFPLGGSRLGLVRRYGNLLLTMVIGGLWHGANWTFVFWGLIHGTLLVLNHGFRYIVPWRPPAWLAIPVTFIAVVLAWVAFRAESIGDMMRIYAIMFGADGIVLPASYQALVSALGPFAEIFSVRTGDVTHFAGARQIAFTIAGLLIVFFAPSSASLTRNEGVRHAMHSRLLPVGLGVTATLVFLTMWVQTNVTFLYFQF